MLVCVAAAQSSAKAPAGRYSIANGEVTDNKTGLIWQQTFNPGARSFDDALAYCATLGGGWRTPNVKELRSLVDESSVAPAIDQKVFPGTPAAEMWSSTILAGTTDSAWFVGFSLGNVFYTKKTQMYPVRCVR